MFYVAASLTAPIFRRANRGSSFSIVCLFTLFPSQEHWLPPRGLGAASASAFPFANGVVYVCVSVDGEQIPLDWFSMAADVLFMFSAPWLLEATWLLCCVAGSLSRGAKQRALFDRFQNAGICECVFSCELNSPFRKLCQLWSFLLSINR